MNEPGQETPAANHTSFLRVQQLVQFSSVGSVVSNSLRPHGLQHSRLSCLSPTPRTSTNSCSLSWWCHPTISSSVVPFPSRLQSFPAWGSFPVSQFFTSGGQSTGASASALVFPVNIQDWFPLGWTGWIYLQSSCSSKASVLQLSAFSNGQFLPVGKLEPVLWNTVTIEEMAGFQIFS